MSTNHFSAHRRRFANVVFSLFGCDFIALREGAKGKKNKPERYCEAFHIISPNLIHVPLGSIVKPLAWLVGREQLVQAVK